MFRPFSSTPVKKIFGAPPSDSQMEVMQKVRETVESNPQLMESLKELQEVIMGKGIFTPGKTPSMIQMMSLLADKEIRGRLMSFKDALEDSGIKLDSKDMSAFSAFFSNQK